MTRELVKHVVRIAKQAYVARVLPAQVPRHVKKRAQDARIMLDSSAVHEGAAPPPAGSWSHEESMLRTGVWCAGSIDGGVESGFSASALGGSHVKRELRTYLADYVSQGSQPSCTKYKEAKRKLLPGMLLGWCLKCKRCLFMFSIILNISRLNKISNLRHVLQ